MNQARKLNLKSSGTLSVNASHHLIFQR